MEIGHPLRKDQISRGNSPRYSSQVEERFSPLATYIITRIFYRFKFPQHQKRQVRANALSYFLCRFLTCDESLAAPVRYTKKPQIF